LTLIALIILAFFFGSIPSGFIVGKIYGVDLRKHGSGNIGATNAGRVLGKRAGAVTLLADLIKGILAVWLASIAPIAVASLSRDQVAALLGVVALVGHCYSPFLSFKGGKGVATGCGVFLALAPVQTALALAIFAGMMKLKGYVSLASISAAATVPLLLIFSSDAHDRSIIIFAIAAATLIIHRHHANITRLLNGTEPKFKSKTADQL